MAKISPEVAFFLGALTGAVLLLINATLLSGVVVRAMVCYIAGVRIHHYLVGLILIGLGLPLATNKRTKALGAFMLGLGVALFFDDFDDLMIDLGVRPK